MNNEITTFINNFVKEIRNNNAAVFIGAGFSKSSGYVDWKHLLENLVNELELDIEKESDFVSLAQYHFNKNQNRSIINNTILEEFSQEKDLSENHRILARLPIFTYWTTNYDSLIEDALLENHRIVDVKYNNEHLSITKPFRDSIVYKMHGDKNNPNNATIIKDDYEKYYRERAPFITTLSGDLISKTFLFVGFSFRDPNIDYLLSRIRIDYGTGNSKQHYSLMRKVKESEYRDNAEYEYAQKKQHYFIEDLKRYNIKVLLMDNFSEITDILSIIERKLNRKNVFISGSAAEYGEWSKEEAISLIHILSKKLINEGFNIISGFGLGLGSYVITGALEEIYLKNKTMNENRLLLRPFPQGIVDDENRIKLWTKYREDMISRAGISIYLFGNKIDSKTKDIILANGMLSEFEIAKKYNHLNIPLGCTGFTAKKIWEDIEKDFEKYFPNIDTEIYNSFYLLNEKISIDKVVENILYLLKKLN